MSNPFGKSRLGGESRINYAKLKDGDNVYRILPAMGDLAEDGRWSMYYAVHYGYKNSLGKMRTFQSSLVKNNKTKMVEVPDAALDRINDLTAKLEKAKADGNQELFERLNKLVGKGKNVKAQFNLDKNHYMMALDLQGNIVVLKLRHKAKMALEVEIKKLRAAGVDPLSPDNGRFFNFHRSGTGNETQTQVTVLMKDVDLGNGRKAKEEVVHAIDDALLKRLMKQDKDGNWTYNEAVNLSTLYPKPTAEQIARIVKEGAKAVDEILDGGLAGAESVAASEDLDPSEYEDAPAQTASAPAQSAPAQQPAQTAQEPAAKAAPPVTTAPPIAPSTVSMSSPSKAAPSVADMSDDDFLASLN